MHAESAQIPLWLTIVLAVASATGSLGIGALIGAYLSHRWQRRAWIGDNKKAEWRQLIDVLTESSSRMEWAFPVPGVISARDAADTAKDYLLGMAVGNQVVADRIFIAESIEKRGIKILWEDLRNYVSSVQLPREKDQQGGLPTITGFKLKSRALQDAIIRAARADLGITKE